MRAPQRLFTPGAGAAPPALTGREQEQGVLTQCLADLAGGSAPPHNVAFMRPARDELNRLGYLWSPPGQLPPIVWVAGIPSLMTYVANHAPPLRPPDASASRDRSDP